MPTPADPFMPSFVDELLGTYGHRCESYQDEFGNWVCGVGSLIREGTRVPITWDDSEIGEHVEADIFFAQHVLTIHCPWAATLDEVRQRVLHVMVFHMGWDKARRGFTPTGLSDHQDLLDAMKRGNWMAARDELMVIAPERPEWARRVWTGQY